MTLGLLGANATAPMARVRAASVSGTHDVPESRLCQTPPFPAPINQCLGSVGWTAMVATRPLLSKFVGSVGVRTNVSGEGPMLTQRACPSAAATDWPVSPRSWLAVTPTDHTAVAAP